MDSKPKERFWTGRVLTRSHARKIIGRLVITLGVIAVLTALTFIGGADSSEVIAFFIFAVLALVLKLTESPVVAAIAMALTALPPLLTVVAGFSLMREGAISPAMFVLGLAWVLLPLACWRGFVATRALRKLPEEAAVETIFE